MKKTILKGMHRPIGIPAFLNPIGFLTSSLWHSVTRKVKFHTNCAYNLNSSKQDDWNKLFGVCFGIMGIHKCSARFGWRYSIEKDAIELCTIVYKNGVPERNIIADCDMALNQESTLELSFDITPSGFLRCWFYVNNHLVLCDSLGVTAAFMYFGCGFYFGGTSRAPHKISANISKV